MDAVAVALASAGLVAAAYEFFAIRFRRTPTVTALVRRIPLPARILLVAAAVAAIVGHFITEAYL